MASENARQHHIVLVPGFVGFDALGQIMYYAGVTDVFRRWSAEHRGVSIHYFDNYPTASVRLRAKRLLDYLTSRVARGEIRSGDSLALVGHSTGGLDIRMLVWQLAETLVSEPRQGTVVDGDTVVFHKEILDLIDRVVFVSVPHFGTNLADLASRYAPVFKALAGDVATGLSFNQGFVGYLRSKVMDAREGQRSHLLLALLDALDESDENPRDLPEKQAKERAARFELMTWLENMAHDFSSIEDLTSMGGDLRSPAHFTPAERAREMDHWKNYEIRAHSFATRVPRTRYDSPGAARSFVDHARRWGPWVARSARLLEREPARAVVATPFAVVRELLELPLIPLVSPVLRSARYAVFDILYAACADPRGPFGSTVRLRELAPSVRDFVSGSTLPTVEISAADNDGIVNTLSMLWPHALEITGEHPIDLVDADHADILGHFALEPVQDPGSTDRRHYAYNIFQQPQFEFSAVTFKRVWPSIFDFCVSRGSTLEDRGVAARAV